MITQMIEVLSTFGFLSAMTFLYLVIAFTIGFPVGIMWVALVDNMNELEATKRFFKEVINEMLLVMVIFSLIAGVGATVLIYLRPLLN